MSDLIFTKFEAVFLELLPQQIHLPYTRESWKEKKQSWEKERDVLIQEGREDLKGKEFPQGRSYEEFVDSYYYRRDGMSKVVQFYYDKGDPDEKELIEQVKAQRIIPKHTGNLARYWDLDWEKDLLKGIIACFPPAMTKVRIDEHRPESKKRERPGREEQPIGRFPTPKGLRWEEITIIFTSNEAVRIKARQISKIYTFAELGFKDGRKGDTPDSRWRIFKEGFARHEGEISYQTDDVTQNTRDNLKAVVKDIRKRLKVFMDLDDDPFYPYRKRQAYKTKFSLRDETPPDSYR